MAKIRDVAAYFCRKYPHKSELSKTRLTKLVYLADWESVKRNGKQITPIRWYFHNFGPYVDNVILEVQSDNRFELITSLNFYGDQKTVISLKDDARLSGLTDEEIEILENVIDETSPMYWDGFIKHVYSTEPIVSRDRYEFLDLESFAKKPA